MRSLSNDELNEISGGAGFLGLAPLYWGYLGVGAGGLGAGLGTGSWISNAFSK